MKYKSLKPMVLIFIFVILFSNLSLAQEDKRLTIQNSDSGSTQNQVIPNKDQVDNFENIKENNQEFIQIRNTNGTIQNETYYYADDKLVAMKDNDGNKFYYHPDHLGSTTLVTNQSGDMVSEIFYLPYGCILTESNGNQRFKFTGKERDSDTGFDYFGARYYDCDFNHFIQADSVIPDIYNPQSLNRYSYVLNNPYKYTDPSGNFAIETTVAIIAGGIVVGSAIIGGVVGGVEAKLNNPQATWVDIADASIAGAVGGSVGGALTVVGAFTGTIFAEPSVTPGIEVVVTQAAETTIERIGEFRQQDIKQNIKSDKEKEIEGASSEIKKKFGIDEFLNLFRQTKQEPPKSSGGGSFDCGTVSCDELFGDGGGDGGFGDNGENDESDEEENENGAGCLPYHC